MKKRETSSWVVVLLCLLAFGGLLIPPGALAKGPIVLKLGHIGSALAPNHFQQLYFAEQVAKKTKGGVKVDVYPAAQLGSANKMIKGLPIGVVDLVPESVGRLAMYEPGFKLFDLPYFLESNEEGVKILNSPVGQELLQGVRKKSGVMLLNYNTYRLPRLLYTTRKPIRAPSDMKGVKIRIKKMKQFVFYWENIGAIPISVAYSELYTALSQGMVEAMEGIITAGAGKKFYEVLKYATMINYTHELHGYYMSERKFKSLSPEFQEILRETAVEASNWYNRESKAEEANAIRAYKKAGVEFIEPDLTPFRKAAEGLPERLEREGEWEKGLYEKMKAAKGGK